MSERRTPAFYALRPGGWRDYWTLLHPPYSLWHLSFVAIGAAVAPAFHADRLWWTLLAFFLAVGISAHALDELRGRPLRTRIPAPVLVALATAGLVAAVAIGIAGMARVSPWLAVFIAVGAFLVPAYNLEWFGGILHSDLVFALGWGGFPALVAFFAQEARLTVPAVAVALACALIAGAQRSLSTPVRMLRRRAVAVRGEIATEDGARIELTADTLRAVPEAALRALWIAMVLLAAGMVAARL